MKIIRHKWEKQNGFRTFLCTRCGCEKKWEYHFGYAYVVRGKMHLTTPECKSTFHNDKK